MQEKKKYYFIVTASGVGKRMNLEYPKQFYEINGVPIYIKTLEKISNSNFVDYIIVTTNKENITLVKEQIIKFGISKVVEVVEGGSERQHSIYNAIKYIEKNTDVNNDECIIGVQDAVRPNIRENYIDDIYNLLANNSFQNKENKDIDGYIVAVPSKDTIKIVNENGIIIDTPKREFLFNAQTPQIFKSKILTKAYHKAYADSYLGTDDSSLVERINGKVKVYIGEYDNIKITTLEDLKYFN